MRKRRLFASMVLLVAFIFVQILSPYADIASNESDGILKGNNVQYPKSTVTDEVYSVAPASGLKNISSFTVTDSVYYITPPEDWDSIAWEKNWDLAEDTLNGVTYGNNLYVAVGDSGVIKTSSDGTKWDLRGSGTDKDIKNVIWNGDIFVAVGLGVILTSEDGISWVKRIDEKSLNLNDVAWDGSKFVVVGDFYHYISADGINWSARSVDVTFRSIIWDNSKFVAVGHSGVIKTSSDGLTWDVSLPPSTEPLCDIASNENKLVAVGFDGVILVSEDGGPWIKATSGITDVVASITWGEGLFVAVGSRGTLMTSADGKVWMNRRFSSSPYYSFCSVTYNNGKFIVIGDNGVVLSSIGGIVWTCEKAYEIDSLLAVGCNDQITVAVGTGGNILTTEDGLDWNIVYGDYSMLTCVIWDGSRFITTGYRGGFIISSDGINWKTVSELGDKICFRGIAYNGDKYVAVGDGGVIRYTVDGKAWTSVTSGTSANIEDIIWNGNIFVAVGVNGTILTSADGVVWTMRYNYDPLVHFEDLVWNGSVFVAVSSSAIFTSADGIKWDITKAFEWDGPESITWDGRQFVSLCYNADMLTSLNGYDWNRKAYGLSSRDVSGLIWNGKKYIAVGYDGLVLTGTPSKISSFSINKNKLKLEVGETEKLYAYVEPEALNQAVNWTTSDAKVATVSADGLVTAKKPGSATISATCASNTAFYAECNVTVVQSIEELMMSEKSFDLTVDAGLSLYVYILPYDTTNNTITWTTTNANVASVSEAKLDVSDGVTISQVLVKGIGAGTATIRATSAENVNIYDECIITVTEDVPHVTGVEVDIDMALIPPGNTLQLTAAVLPESFDNREVTWTTTDESIATVSADGLVRGISAGTARIRATSVADTAYYDECIVTVPVIAVTKVELNKTTTNISVGTTEKLNASVLPENATNKAISWTTNSASVALVSSDGLVTGVGVGTATIRVTSTADETKYAECEVIVNAPSIPVSQVNLNRSSANIYTGNTLQLLVSVLPSDATDKRVTWTTSKPQIASVSQTGSVKGVGVGTAVIRVTSVADSSKYAECTVYVTDYIKTPPTGGGGGGGGGGGAAGGSVVEVPKAKPQPVVANGTVSIDNMEVEGNGVLSTSITPEIIESAFSSAQTGTNGLKTIDIALQKVPGASVYSVGLPAANLTAASGTQNAMINITTEFGTVSLPNNMMTPEVVGQGLQVEMHVGKTDINALSPELKAKIGNRPVLDLSIAVDGKAKEWNNPDAPVTVAIDYTPTEEELENPDNIVVWYIDGMGNAVEVPSGRYDPATGKVIFSVTHFSKYAVGYAKVSMKDIGEHKWADKEINAVVVRGILKPVSDKSFAPGDYITRADFIYGLVRALGLSSKVEGNFEDIDSTDYYYNEIGIAKKLGISNGDGNNKFGADNQITRQDMMTMITRAINISQKANIHVNQDILSKYSDSGEIASYARNSVAAMVSEGIIKGTGDRINPAANTSRAEAALIIYRMYSKYMK